MRLSQFADGRASESRQTTTVWLSRRRSPSPLAAPTHFEYRFRREPRYSRSRIFRLNAIHRAPPRQFLSDRLRALG